MDKTILKIRKVNKNNSVGTTFPAEMVKKVGFKDSGHYICSYQKNEKENKLILEIDLNDIIK